MEFKITSTFVLDSLLIITILLLALLGNLNFRVSNDKSIKPIFTRICNAIAAAGFFISATFMIAHRTPRLDFFVFLAYWSGYIIEMFTDAVEDNFTKIVRAAIKKIGGGDSEDDEKEK